MEARFRILRTSDTAQGPPIDLSCAALSNCYFSKKKLVDCATRVDVPRQCRLQLSPLEDARPYSAGVVEVIRGEMHRDPSLLWTVVRIIFGNVSRRSKAQTSLRDLKLDGATVCLWVEERRVHVRAFLVVSFAGAFALSRGPDALE